MNGAHLRAWSVSAALAVAFFLVPGAAHAATQTFDAGSTPVIRVQSTSGHIHIVGWNQSTVEINSSNGINVQRGDANFVASHYPRSISIPGFTPPASTHLPTMPAESFALPDLGSGAHKGIFVRGNGDITMRIPVNTTAIFADVANGQIAMNNLRGTTIIATTRQGAVLLRNVSGTVFAQTLRGPVVAVNSNFERIRARSLVGNLSFAHCDVQQISASTVNGSVMYDDGRFRPGLAHFESSRGSVAIGVAAGSNAQVNATRGSMISRYSSQNGPVVTAAAGRSVMVYGGSLESHPTLAGRVPVFAAPAFARARKIRAGGAFRPAATRTQRRKQVRQVRRKAQIRRRPPTESASADLAL